VTGIPGCTQCTYAVARANTFKCTACGSGYKLEGETCVSSSANKSSLSTGAIAGISVAAVVVVGGLVGFLCWWFICRGKA
ncbi:Variant-specific surface protein, partial [Giardia duodenalis]